MREFRLPDTLKALMAKEGRLKEDLALRHTEYQMVSGTVPRGFNPHALPEFYALMIAHRRWQFAHEKIIALRRRVVQA